MASSPSALAPPNMYSSIIVWDDTVRKYFAYHPTLDGAMAQGETMREAEQNLKDAIEMVIQHYKENGLELPDLYSMPSAICFSELDKRYSE